MMRRKLIAGYLAAVFVLLTIGVSKAAADEVTPVGNKLWANGASGTYAWKTGQDEQGNPLSVPTWVRTVITNVITSGFADASTNNSNTVRYSNASSGDVEVRWSTSAISACGSTWIGCADATQYPYRIWLRSDVVDSVAGKTWCDLNLQSGCPDAGRAAIHEIGHVSGFLAHYVTLSFARSRMTTRPPYYGEASSYDARTLGRCDEAALQLMYDVDTTSGPYANCFDEVTNHGANGLITDLTATPGSSAVCSGTTVTIAGRLQVHDYSSYGPLGGNGLAGRTIWIDRGATAKYTSAVAASGSGNNWSKQFTLSTLATVTYNYAAHYDRPSGEGLDSSSDATFSITWVRPSDC